MPDDTVKIVNLFDGRAVDPEDVVIAFYPPKEGGMPIIPDGASQGIVNEVINDDFRPLLGAIYDGTINGSTISMEGLLKLRELVGKESEATLSNPNKRADFMNAVRDLNIWH